MITGRPQVAVIDIDSPQRDAFGKARVSNPTSVFDCSFRYDTQPLVFEPITATGGTVTHDATNVSISLNTTGTSGSQALIQSYKTTRYQPGKSQLIKISAKFPTITTNRTCRVGYSDGSNGIVFEQVNGVMSLVRLSTTSEAGATVLQSDWNFDKLDGRGPSGILADWTKEQLFWIDAQWQGVGRVRAGVVIDGAFLRVHYFMNANNISAPYTATFTLPVYAENILTGAGSIDALKLTCIAVESEGGVDTVEGYTATAKSAALSASTTRASILSIRPKLTFNSITNRTEIAFQDLAIINPGAAPIYWELSIGATFSVAPTFTDVNATYSAVEYSSTVGTLTSPGIVIASGFVPNAQGSGAVAGGKNIVNRYPLSLDKAGARRAMGTLTLSITTTTGTSAGVVASFNWLELR